MILSSINDLGYAPQRIISIVPSQTELLASLELDEETIGITKFCVHPSEWLSRKIKTGGTKNLNIEKIIALDPDLIIANKEENEKEQVEILAEKFPVWITTVTNLASSLQMIADIGQLTGKEENALKIITNIKTSFRDLDYKISKLIPPIPACYLIWKDPYMTIGGDTFINDMLMHAGFQNIFASTTRYPIINMQQLADLNCIVLLLSSEPYPFNEKHISTLQASFSKMKILLVNGEMFSWYGSRLLEAPAYFHSLHERIANNA